jgi:hypothetical protein
MYGIGTDEDISAETVPAGLTIGELIDRYQTDRVSGWRKLRYATRQNHDCILRRMKADRGTMRIADIQFGAIDEMYLDWSADGTKKAMGHAMMAQLRRICRYGVRYLGDPECRRVKSDLSDTRFEVASPQQAFMTAEWADAVCARAHDWGYHSIAVAQAFQFDIVLRQRDVIGEYVPLEEPGESDVIWRGMKWLRGLRWGEIDNELVLTHITSKRQKPIVVDLKLAPMVHREILLMPDWLKGKNYPLVICEATGAPWLPAEFRRKWRMIADACGIPKEVKNMHSRHGGVTEGTDAGLSLEQMRHAATHSSVQMTAKYSRNAAGKIAESLKARAAYRAAKAAPVQGEDRE